MVQTYWHVGRLIVEGEQGGHARAAYGQRTLPLLAERLTAEFGKGFSAQSLWSFRQFHLEFAILSTAWRELSWSHYRLHAAAALGAQVSAPPQYWRSQPREFKDLFAGLRFGAR
jgi:DUF1016 N-terminal domain